MGFRVVALRVARGLTWLLVAWVLLRGVVDIVAPPPEAAAEPSAPPPAAAAAPAHLEGPGAFAALFTREYFTWLPGDGPGAAAAAAGSTAAGGGSAGRAQRLQPFLAARVDRQAGWSPGPNLGAQVAEATWPYRVEELTDAQWLVTVAARVTTWTEDVAEAEAGAVSRVLYLAVPVAQVEGGYLVNDYPTLVPGPRPAAREGPPLAGEPVDDPDNQVRTLLTGFFRAYAAGGEDALYYLEPELELRGLGGALTFREVAELELRRVGDETWAHALVRFTDPVSGAASRQRYSLQVVQRDGRWYIADLLQKGD